MRFVRLKSVLNLLAVLAFAVSLQAATPPVAKMVPHVDTVLGHVRQDNYFWIREKTNPEVISYLEAENAYTDTMMASTKGLQDSLFKEIVARIKETDLTVPEKHDDFYYYSRTEKGKQYSIYCRKKGNLESPERVILDVNELAKGHEFYSLGAMEISPNHVLMGLAYDTNGSEIYTIVVRDIETGKESVERIGNSAGSIQWANDNQTIFYTTLDDIMRPYRLYRHTIGEDPSKDVLIYEEPDDAYYMDLGKSNDEKYLILTLGSTVTTEVRYLDASTPMGEWKVVTPREHEMEYYVEHHDNRFLIVTNDKAKNFRLVEAPETNPSKANWKELIGNRDSVKLDDIDVFKDYMAIYEREKGLRTIRIQNFASGEIHPIKFPEPVYSYTKGSNADYNTSTVRFTYSSLVTPRSVFDYDMGTRELTLQKQQEVLGGYNPDDYECKQLFATAKDGVRIPISLVYKKGTVLNGENPTFLYAYGAYGSPTEPGFGTTRLSLINRGFVYAIAHVRGGGEMGRHWYEDGKLLNKKNTFTDFIACAEHLVAEKYTNPKKLAILGGSAGGLTMGAVTNMRPDLFQAVVYSVPFVDVMNTMLDPTIPLTVIEYEEWGNPAEAKYYDYMQSYSPYDNIKPVVYPNILVEGGLNDPRVGYWEPTKLVAKMRTMKTGDNMLILKTNMGHGHMGSSGRYDQYKDVAFEYAFILKALGMVQ